MDDNGGKAPEPEPGGVVLDSTGWYWLRRYVTAKVAAAKWEADRVHARDKLVEIMKNYDHGHHNGRRVVSVIRVKPMRFKEAAFAEDHPELWDRYREPLAEQVRISPTKGEDIPYSEIDEDDEQYHHEYVGGDGRKWTDESGTWAVQEDRGGAT